MLNVTVFNVRIAIKKSVIVGVIVVVVDVVVIVVM